MKIHLNRFSLFGAGAVRATRLTPGAPGVARGLAVGVGVLALALYVGFRVMAQSSQYQWLGQPGDPNATSTAGWSPTAGISGSAWTYWKRSTLAIPDGSNDVSIAAGIPACTATGWPGQHTRLAFRTSAGYTGTQSAYQVVVSQYSCASDAVAYLGVFNGATQLLSVELPTFPSGGGVAGFIRNDGAYPGLVIQVSANGPAGTVNLGEWYVASATGLTGLPAIGSTDGNLVGVLATIDRTAPAAVSGVTTARWPHTVDAQWTAGADAVKFDLYRNGVYVGTTTNKYFTFPGLAPSTAYTFGVVALNYHNSAATMTTFSATTTALGSLPSQVTPRRVGVHRYASTWGGQGEAIDTLSGNLNYSAGLVAPMIRAAGEVPIGLTYNSQIWRADNSGWWELGRDVGYGYGWRLLAGALTPVWVDANTFGYWLYTDASGAEYRLDQVSAAGEWSSVDGFYGVWDPGTKRLRSTDGSSAEFLCTSGATEADAGTLYPTQMRTTNGNWIKLRYRPAIGTGGENTSSRLWKIEDVGGERWTLNYNADAIPHLTSVTGPPGAGKNVAYVSASVLRPDGVGVGTKTMLASVSHANLPLTTAFTYTTYAELSKVVTPYGGELQWDYALFTYLNNVRLREVSQRRLVKQIGAAANAFNFTRPSGDSGQPVHTGLTIVDVGASAAKDWTFSATANYTRGFVTRYDERASSSSAVLRRSDFTYTLDGVGMPYTASATTTLDVGTGSQVATKTEQTLDVYGNATQTRLFAFNALTTPLKTINCSYWAPAVNPLRIRNRLVTCSATQGGETRTMVTMDYDQVALASWTAGPVAQHDTSAFGIGFTARGNMTGVASYGGRATGMRYNILGEPVLTTRAGTSVATTYSAANNWVAPVAMAPNSLSSMQTSMTWNSWFAPTASNAPNGAQATVQYDNVTGRPTSSGNNDTGVSYSYNDAARQMTTTSLAGVVRTTFDGLGRPIRTEKIDNGLVVHTTDTEYEPCGCTPFGKVKRVSLPYAPGGSPQWTTMVYDALGRTVAVQQPASSGTSTTAYAGNTVTVTDPAGRWKKYTSDALGNLTQVTEPNPAGGASYETYYTYNVAGQMTQVSMPRPNVGLPGSTTQVRTFVYNTSGYLTSATNPENGTVSYFYTASGLLDYKLDAKGQKVKYTYDALERVSKIEPFATSSSSTPIDCEVVTNHYDQWATAVGRLSSQVWGDKDLTKCSKGEVRYEYLYTATGRVAQKKVVVKQRRQDPLDSNPQTQWKDYEAELPVGYEYTSGLHTKTTYPTTNPYDGTTFQTLPGHVYNYAYDSQARPVSATYQVNPIANTQSMVSGVTYNAFSQMTQMQWTTPGQGGLSTQQWTFDSLLRLTGIPTMGLAYSYSATADDGKITAMTYTAQGYSVNYSYDSLGRLASANSSGNQWGLSYLYDGFGNRLQQNVTKAGPGYTPPSSNLFVDPSTNRVNSWTYDANGNATSIPGVGAIGFDWANRVTTVGSETYGYDPGNKRLWKNAQLTLWGGLGEEIGRFELQWLLDTWTETTIGGGTQTRTEWKLKFKQNSTLRWFAGRKLQWEDRLGSANGTFYPYGEEITSWASNPSDKFGTYHRDGTGLDYADQRYYHAGSGRFATTDPLDGSAKPERPSSWNRFSYTEGDPTNSLDPRGLDIISLYDGAVTCNTKRDSETRDLVVTGCLIQNMLARRPAPPDLSLAASRGKRARPARFPNSRTKVRMAPWMYFRI